MRDVVAWMFIGLNGKGKSTLLIEFMKQYKRSKPRNRVVVFDQNESVPINLYNEKLTLKNYESLLTTARNTLFIIDDYRMIFYQDRPESFWHEFFGTRRMRNNDIIFSCHSPSEVMNFLARYIDKYFIWYTQDANTCDKKIAAAKTIMEAKAKVDAHAQKISADDYMKRYPNFPHAVVDTLTLKINYYNFK
jgi:chromosomal replication initiation ATPase DnaA